MRGADLLPSLPPAGSDPTAFVTAMTVPGSTPLLPEVRLHLAEEVIELWEETERHLQQLGVAPPFWAFAWPGGQALARYLLDHPATVQGRRVLDVAAGSGVAAIAAARAGAADVTATEIDPLAAAAISVNATANAVTVAVRCADVLAGSGEGADVVLVGDLCYERDLAARTTTFLERAAAGGALVLVGDPGRAYLPRERLQHLIAYEVPVLAGLEDRDTKSTTVYRMA